jgi:hypothetical protein
MAAASSWSFQTFPFPVKRIGMAWKDQRNLLGRSWKLQGSSESPDGGGGVRGDADANKTLRVSCDLRPQSIRQ